MGCLALVPMSSFLKPQSGEGAKGQRKVMASWLDNTSFPHKEWSPGTDVPAQLGKVRLSLPLQKVSFCSCPSSGIGVVQPQSA